jgi:hypothetical protein
MRKLFVTALVASIALGQPASAGEPETGAAAERAPEEKDRPARAVAKPKSGGAAAGKDAPARGRTAAEPGAAAHADEPKPAEKPCEPVKPCPIDG